MVTFQKLVHRLKKFWEEQGCIVQQGYDLEVGAGTFNPATFLRCLGPEPYRTCYVEPSRRPTDGRYGLNPNRVQHYFQFQVMLKPSPLNLQELYLQSLEAIGFNLQEHDIRFVHDDWESPTLGASGLGWEVWMDGMEITQFTYFQNCGGIPLHPITGELTYGLERLALYIQKVESIFDIQWDGDITYGDIYQQSEHEWSLYNFEESDSSLWLNHFDAYEKEASSLVKKGVIIPAYDFVMKASHAFNMLDARGVISVTERTSYIARVRQLACEIAEAYLLSREKQKFPLMNRFKEIQKEAPVKLTPRARLPEELMQASSDERKDFLLEIGSEELPASFIEPALETLQGKLKALFEKEKIPYKAIEMYGTPRRLAACVKELALAKPARTEERRGPAAESLFEADGSPKLSAQGFFKAAGVKPTSLQEIKEGRYWALRIGEMGGKEYIFSAFQEESRPTADILMESLPGIILGIDFPKRMRWSNLDISYARPLRWIVSLFGKHVVPFTVGNITAGRESKGHSQLHPWAFAILKAEDYLPILRDHKVIADIAERKKIILKKIQEIEERESAQAVEKERVLNLVVNLVEWPELLTGTFKSEYLKAPKEVLISEMVEHQKYFPLIKRDGTLKSSFIITANTKPGDKVREGNERALSSRLADGLTLFEIDLKTPLAELNDRLKSITYQKDLGSVFAKVERLIKHAAIIQRKLGISTPDSSARAALLSKCDMASKMVFEFPDLQGTMGRLFALAHGESDEVALAIEEHWMPRGEIASLPSTPTGIVISLAEKFDNLLGSSLAGLKATSSSDPYALRRQALAIIKILINNSLRLPLRELMQELLANFPDRLKKGKEGVVEEVLEFLMNRIRTVFLEFGFQKDEIEASAAIGFNDIYDSFLKTKAFQNFREKEGCFRKLFEVYKRARGQLSNQVKTDFSEALLEERAEISLHKFLKSTDKPFHSAMSLRRYDEAYGMIAELQPALATLFDEVKILSEDPKIQSNRIALLQLVFDRFEKLLDFSKIRE